jgi:hypothetical protein
VTAAYTIRIFAAAIAGHKIQIAGFVLNRRRKQKAFGNLTRAEKRIGSSVPVRIRMLASEEENYF